MKEIKESSGGIAIPTRLLSYYLLIYCCYYLGKKDLQTEYLRKFEGLVHDTKNPLGEKFLAYVRSLLSTAPATVASTLTSQSSIYASSSSTVSSSTTSITISIMQPSPQP